MLLAGDDRCGQLVGSLVPLFASLALLASFFLLTGCETLGERTTRRPLRFRRRTTPADTWRQPGGRDRLGHGVLSDRYVRPSWYSVAGPRPSGWAGSTGWIHASRCACISGSSSSPSTRAWTQIPVDGGRDHRPADQMDVVRRSPSDGCRCRDGAALPRTGRDVTPRSSLGSEPVAVHAGPSGGVEGRAWSVRRQADRAGAP